MHCENPVCAAVCTTGAMSKSDYGAVLYEPDICIACRSCVLACPYKVPQYDEEAKGIVKCSMCAHRVVQGNIPACVEACPTSALEFGEAKALRAKAEKIAAEEGLVLYGVGTNVMVLTTKEPTSLGYPKAPVVTGKRSFLGEVFASLIEE
jgi:Fe-S-cluster-containing dehydrogenase component